MTRLLRAICILAILVLSVPVMSPVKASSDMPAAYPSNCNEVQVPIAGSATFETYLYCMPAVANWNGGLVIFAHGYVFDYPATANPTLPVEQITMADGKTLPGLVNALGYGFAMTSYRKNGLAVLDGVQSTLDLVSYVKATIAPDYGETRQVLVVGASEGGLVTTQLIEQHADVFAGGVAVCGPVGDFRQQIDYWGDFRALYDYFFPTVLPPSEVDIPTDLMADWYAFPYVAVPVEPLHYQNKVINALTANLPTSATLTRYMMNISGAPYVLTFDPNVYAQTVGASTLGILTYNVLATNEARDLLSATAGSTIQPYDNSERDYKGAGVPADVLTALNAPTTGIGRITSVGDVTAALAPYQTSGVLTVPLINMHTKLDPIVPFWHQALYTSKVRASGSSPFYKDIAIDTYGHCAFSTVEMVYAFARLIHDVDQKPVPLAALAGLLDNNQTLIDQFKALNTKEGDVTTVIKRYLPSITR